MIRHQSHFSPRSSRWIALTLSLAAVLSVSAGPFTIDPDRSTIRLSGSALGSELTEQKPGSLTTRYEGTIGAETAGGTITFGGTSRMVAQNSGDWEPAAGGASGKAPANYGGQASVFGASALAAVRRVEFNLLSQPIALNGESFDAGTVTFQFLSSANGVLDYRVVSIFFGTEDSEELAGLGTNQVGAIATLVRAGDIETLTLPIQAKFFFKLSTPNDTVLELTGQLVATRPAEGGSSGGFTDWLAEIFPGVSDPAIIGPGADGDGDGLANLVEYAFDLNPGVPDIGFSPLQAGPDPGNAGQILLEYVRPKGVPGVDYVILAGDQVGNLTPQSLPVQITDLGNGQERVRMTDAVPPTGQRFYLLGVAPK